jgi:serine phosphatase RsbU (regulator of sigma subunit)/integral membrane sensor domain MASE1
MDTDHSPRRTHRSAGACLRRRLLATFAAVAVAYALLATSAYELFGALSIGVTFFPPAGLTFAAFVLLPRERWPAIATAIVVGEVVVNLSQGQPLAWSLGWAVANLTEPLVGALVVLRLCPRPMLDRRFAAAFLLGGLLVGPACGALIGASVLDIADQISWPSAVGDVFVGDALGVLVVAPLVFVLVRPGRFVVNRTRPIDAVVVALLASAACGVLIALDDLPIGYGAIPLLAVPAVRYSARELAVAGAVVAGWLTAATARGRGPWASGDGSGAQADLVQQQAFLIVALGAAWLLKLEVLDRVRAREAAARAEAELHLRQESQARDRAVADALQQAVMPPALPHVAGATIDAAYRPATTALDIGGDWYDVVVETGAVTLVIGDAVGHNLGAAAAMGRLAPAARALAVAGHGPADLLHHLDRLAEEVPGAQMATLVCARIELSTGQMTYSVAGHPPPLLRSPDGSVDRLQGARGVPLAAISGVVRTEVRHRIEPGSVLLLYTDGLIERRGIPFDRQLDRLAERLSRWPADDQSMDGFCSCLAAELERDGHDDDVALIAIRLG